MVTVDNEPVSKISEHSEPRYLS